MAKKNGKKGGQPSKYGSPYQPRASGSSQPARSGQVTRAVGGRRKSRSPALWLIGACALAAGVAVIGSCSDDGDDEAVTVRRASYASQADCEADWNAPEDCEGVPVDDIHAASLADAAGSDGSSASTSGGGHGGGYYGGYHGGMARWYGPYYTESGTVYHPDGTQTRCDMSSGMARPMGVYDGNGNLARVSQAPGTPHATMIEEATLSRSSLGRGAGGGMSMRSAAVSRAPAVSSRGGFTSRFGGSGRSGGG
ncbi:hypothetical protein OR16_02140 [Cupriavidus basilensis OR16]|uniref:Uncharacterized protein n=1 Tax=Cupriavidus basilensis OR16 TaxID=1127483 RepID=H1RYS8_9BURK|nr:hypothetical protein [Cupriavidus basilensis]EHP44769.1 hypothetical protein OR16_02140 [Cupriavidus basilensis OR16]